MKFRFRHTTSLILFLLLGFTVMAQETFPVNGIKDDYKGYIAFVNATITTDPYAKIEKGTLLIKENRIVAVGKHVKLPKETIVYDLKGHYIYPAFIDVYSNYGLPEVKKQARKRTPQFISNERGALSWNEAIHPEYRADAEFEANPKEAKELMQVGFGAVVTHKQDGIMRGTGALVMLGKEQENLLIASGMAASFLSFNKGTSTQDYPSSLMGCIALIKQTYYDARWYKNSPRKTEYNASLEALNHQMNLPQIFDPGNDYLSNLRASKMGAQFGINYVLLGSGKEYKRPEKLKETGNSVILPINYPKPFDVEDPYDALLIPLEELKHWELAPSNASILSDHGVEYSFTFKGHKTAKEFWDHLLETAKRGLTEQQILASLTTIPAKQINQSHQLGSLLPGKLANFLITSDTLLSPQLKIYQNWINGKPYNITPFDEFAVKGNYDLNLENHIYRLAVKGEQPKLSGEVTWVEGNDTLQYKVVVKQSDQLISVAFEAEDTNYTGFVRLSGSVHFNSGILEGRGQLPGGRWIKWSAIKQRQKEDKEKDDKKDSTDVTPGKVWFPNMAYGFDSMPGPQNTIYRNATIWTCDTQGKLEHADIWVRNGKIYKIGTKLQPSGGAKVVDATGMHITPGIVDEHSHIAISRGVNEGTQAVTAEVSIGDVVNSDDINMYRQLAGGVTTAQLLHGSANPIGGQSALIKLKWGRAPEEMKIPNAPGFIKFALGENVKQSNWGDHQTVRYPQTRMGVEQVYYDAFYRARDYEKAWNDWNKLSDKEKELSNQPRKDLELDALVEILHHTRFITCHSYIQSEINMLMHVADSMGFKINTFTHILEGYKVADKMKEHGAAGSTFSDWWAYKYEVNDAIPYNAAMLNMMGVNTAINSDDAEMGRRLNQEAAKAVKYGGTSEEEALNMVTINPAKMLHLDNRIGSLVPGKDADLVIWTGHPLSVSSRVKQTLIEGVCYYSEDQDQRQKEALEAERTRIIAKMIKAKKNGAKTKPAKPRKQKLYHCDTVTDELVH